MLKRGQLQELARRLCEEWGKGFRYLVQTSKAATMVWGGVKVNALPEQAGVIFNSRIQARVEFSLFSKNTRLIYDDDADYQSDSSIEEHQHIVGNALKTISRHYDLSLTAFGHRLVSSDSSTKGNVTVNLVRATDPSPVTSFRGNPVWDTFAQAVRTAMGNEVVVAPSLMTGNTDTQRCEF
jgi:Gly-Xaa carboxypeptidase